MCIYILVTNTRSSDAPVVSGTQANGFVYLLFYRPKEAFRVVQHVACASLPLNACQTEAPLRGYESKPVRALQMQCHATSHWSIFLRDCDYRYIANGRCLKGKPSAWSAPYTFTSEHCCMFVVGSLDPEDPVYGVHLVCLSHESQAERNPRREPPGFVVNAFQNCGVIMYQNELVQGSNMDS